MRLKQIVCIALMPVVFGAIFWHFSAPSEVAAQVGSRTRGSGSGSGSRGSGSGSATQGSGTMVRQQTYEQKLWGYIQRVHYKNWSPVPGTSGDAYAGESPHGAFLKMYLNREAAGHMDKPPYGSMIIKENFGKDAKTLMAVTVMYRSKDYDPANNDWYWVKFNPDGTVARAPAAKGGMQLSGKVKGCIDCHSSAAGKDMVFANDK